jgi:choline dehydrogenase
MKGVNILSKKKDQKVFDYIIIGAGTAGGVIAKELSDDRHNSVLVLEAGTNMTKELSNPDLLVSLFNSTDNRISFNVATKLQSNIGRQLILGSGRVIGGSSEHSAMLTVRGSSDLYNAWAALVGDNQWSYNVISSLFIKNETYTGMTQTLQERGDKGPIFVRQQNIPDQGLIQTLAQATSEIFSVPIEKDYNTGIRDVTTLKGQYNQKEENGKFVRSSTATGYLNNHIVTQGNEFKPDEFGIGRRLTIFAKTTVNKILFKKKKGYHLAVGVEFIKDGVSQVSFARKGIIVSAGNFSSVILQRSGIGKFEDLVNAGIRPLIESPQVGYNFQTHYFVGMGVRVKTSRLLPIIDADLDQPGVLGAFKKVSNPIGGRRLQLLGVPNPLFVPSHEVITNGWVFSRTNPTNIMSIAISDVNPKSRGTIMVAHSDPEAYPSVDLKPLSNQDDLNFMIERYIETYNMIVRARQLDMDGLYQVVYPDESIFLEPDENKKRAQLAAYARASYANFSHFGGQCTMGTKIENGVVNKDLDVFGTKNLKVADLSISPILPDGNTSTAAQMIGLNAVRFIQNDPHSYIVGDSEFEDFLEDEIDDLEENSTEECEESSSDE